MAIHFSRFGPEIFRLLLGPLELNFLVFLGMPNTVPLPMVLERQPSNNKGQIVRKLVLSKFDKGLVNAVLKILIYPITVDNFAALFN